MGLLLTREMGTTPERRAFLRQLLKGFSMVFCLQEFIVFCKGFFFWVGQGFWKVSSMSEKKVSLIVM